MKKIGAKKSIEHLPMVSHPQQQNENGNRNGKARPCNEGHKPKDPGMAIPGR